MATVIPSMCCKLLIYLAAKFQTCDSEYCTIDLDAIAVKSTPQRNLTGSFAEVLMIRMDGAIGQYAPPDPPLRLAGIKALNYV